MPEPRQSRLSIAAHPLVHCYAQRTDVADPGKLSMPQVSPDLSSPLGQRARSLSQQSGAKKDQTRLGSLACRICMQV
jgi:hypothetical protein